MTVAVASISLKPDVLNMFNCIRGARNPEARREWHMNWNECAGLIPILELVKFHRVGVCASGGADSHPSAINSHSNNRQSADTRGLYMTKSK